MKACSFAVTQPYFTTSSLLMHSTSLLSLQRPSSVSSSQTCQTCLVLYLLKIGGVCSKVNRASATSGIFFIFFSIKYVPWRFQNIELSFSSVECWKQFVFQRLVFVSKTERMRLVVPLVFLYLRWENARDAQWTDWTWSSASCFFFFCYRTEPQNQNLTNLSCCSSWAGNRLVLRFCVCLRYLLNFRHACDLLAEGGAVFRNNMP